ncbi:MAG: hypothetical protein ACTHJR_06445 [Sphingomonas sp.]|uniref:hypothetical protein n=1 Tax=Sphingomonas sp. TaxID=28214 RepID=UPI003F804527
MADNALLDLGHVFELLKKYPPSQLPLEAENINDVKGLDVIEAIFKQGWPERALVAMLRKAMIDKKAVKFTYEGLPRTVEVHAFGESSKGHLLFRGFQTAGESENQLPNWRLFNLSKIPVESFDITNVDSLAPRPGYKQGDSQMTVFSELKVA